MDDEQEYIIQRCPIDNDFGQRARVCGLKHYCTNQIQSTSSILSLGYLPVYVMLRMREITAPVKKSTNEKSSVFQETRSINTATIHVNRDVDECTGLPSYQGNRIAFGIKQQMQLRLQRDTCNNVHLICLKQQGKLLCRYCKAFQHAFLLQQCLLASVMKKLTALPSMFNKKYNKEVRKTRLGWFEHLTFRLFFVSSHEKRLQFLLMQHAQGHY